MTPRARNRSRESLVLTTLLHLLNHGLHSMLPPLYLSIQKDFGLTRIAPIFLGATLYLFFFSIFQLPMGILSDRWNRKWMLGIGGILNSLFFIGVGLSRDYPSFLVMMSLSGLWGSVYHPVGNAFLADLYPHRKGSALGVSGIGATAGLSLAPVAGAALAAVWGWRVAVAAFGVAGIVIGVLFLLLAMEPRRGGERAALGAAMKENGLLLFFLAVGAIFAFREFCGWGGYSVLSVFCQITYHFSLQAGGIANGIQSVGGFIMQPLGGFLSDRFGRRLLGSALLIGAGVTMAVTPFVGPHFVLPVAFLYGVFYTGTVPIVDAMIGDRTPSAVRGTVYGLLMTFGIGIGSFSPWAVGNILDAFHRSATGFHFAFGALGLSCFLSGLFFLIVFPIMTKKGRGSWVVGNATDGKRFN